MQFTFATLLTLPLLALSAPTAEPDTNLNVRGGTPLSQAAAQSRLEGAGIGWYSSGNCRTKTNGRCTSYDGLLSGTVDQAIVLKNACNCALTITGGTETGHAGGTYSHGTGYKLDFRKDTGINNYVTRTFTEIAPRSNGDRQWQAASGNIYCDEGNHWDVLFY